MQNEKMFHIYEGFFGGVFNRDGFGLQGNGRLFINGERGTAEISADRPLPMLITLLLTLVPFSRLFRTLYRPSKTYTFSVNQIRDFTQQGRSIRFRAPKNDGAMKRTSFTARSEAEAQEITNAINNLNLRQPSPGPGGWPQTSPAGQGAAAPTRASMLPKLLLFGGLLAVVGAGAFALYRYIDPFKPKPPAGAFPQQVSDFTLERGPEYSKYHDIGEAKNFQATYHKSDGAWVEYYLWEFPSADAARKEWQSRKQYFADTLKKEPGKFQFQQSETGLAVSADSKSAKYADVYWTNGPHLIEIHSLTPSLSYEFESKLPGHPFVAPPTSTTTTAPPTTNTETSALKKYFPQQVGDYRMEKLRNDGIDYLRRDSVEALFASYFGSDKKRQIDYHVSSFASPEEAARRLEAALSENVNDLIKDEIVSRDPLMKDGRQVGSRVVLKSARNDKSEWVLWTDGNLLFSVLSFQKDAADFAKKLPS